jgi:phosphatidylinositol kinase/protein kinase (PI-3  family)
MINDSMCIDEIHKKTCGGSLKDYFVYNFGKGRRKSPGFKKARNEFLYSLVAYSLACYILNVKDRHN